MTDDRQIELGRGMMEVLKDTCQGLLVINGGTATALGALLQALWPNAAPCLKGGIANAMAALALGMLFAVVTLFFRFVSLHRPVEANAIFANGEGKAAVACGFLSAAMFVAGVFLARNAVTC